MSKLRLLGTAHLTTVVVVLSALVVMSAPAGATRAGPIDAVTVSPAEVEVATPNDLTFRFSASPSEPFKGQAVTRIPAGWSAPQADDAAAPGHVSVDAGSCKRAALEEVVGDGPWTVVVEASCKAGAAFTLHYDDATAPSPPGVVTFISGSGRKGWTEPVSPAPTVDVLPTPPSALRFSGVPEGTTAGDAITLTVEALDRDGNRAVRQSSRLVISTTDGHAVLPATVDLREGVATIAGELRTAGLQMITVRVAGDGDGSGDGGPAVASSSPEIAVRPGPLASITVDASSQSVLAGVPVDVALRGSDRFGNPVDPAGAAVSAGPDATCDGWTCTAWSAGSMTIDAVRGGATGSATIDVVPEVVAVEPAAVPGAMLGEPYRVALTAPGAIRGATFAVVGGALPAGLSLSASGAVAGTPSSLGSSSFTVRATDGNGVRGERTYAVDVTLPILADVAALDFGSLARGGTSAAVRVTLTNHGSVGFVLGARGLSNRSDFAAPIDDDSCFTSDALEPGMSCSALVTFTPSTTGVITGRLEWAYDIGTVVLNLRGTAT